MTEHQEQIKRQFSRQARGFAYDPEVRDTKAINIVLRMTGVNKEKTVLDVACGPGILSCAFARKAKQVTGLDLVPAMLGQARKLQKKNGLTNMDWKLGDASALPYPDNVFSVVSCRYSFHHIEAPARVLAEMKRVCRSGGKVVVIDMLSAEDSEKAVRFNHLEKLRDPSHVWALSLTEMKTLMKKAGFAHPDVEFYNLDHELESFMNRSFPGKENETKVRSIIHEAVDKDLLGIKVFKEGDIVKFPYPVAVLCGIKK